MVKHRAGHMTQVIEHLLSKCKAMSSNPSTPPQMIIMIKNNNNMVRHLNLRI
jgi:hypothetical protein